jgi:NAD(P)-dependent dehydrogenase (short-subunit alcohol dehydrogenase family)
MSPDREPHALTLPTRLSGKVAIISGAGSSGPGVSIGRAISALYARAGARVALVDLRRDEAELTQQMILDGGGDPDQMLVEQADVTAEADCKQTVRRVIDRW